MARLWYAAQISPHMQTTADFNLKRQGFVAFFPRVVTKATKNRQVLETQPLFKGYAFVELDLEVDQWLSVNYTYGVIHLLPKWSEIPNPVPAGLVESLQAHDPLFDDNLVDVLQEFAPGCAVRIRSGLLQGVTGSVISKQGKFVELLFTDLVTGNSARNKVLVPKDNLETVDK